MAYSALACFDIHLHSTVATFHNSLLWFGNFESRLKLSGYDLDVEGATAIVQQDSLGDMWTELQQAQEAAVDAEWISLVGITWLVKHILQKELCVAYLKGILLLKALD